MDITPNVFTLGDENDPQHVYEDLELVEHINDCFANIGKKLADDISNKLNGNQTFLFEHLVTNNLSDKISSVTITRDELVNVLKLIDVNKSAAIENVRSKVIIDAYMVQRDRMLKIYNGSLTHCMYPASWKRSTVIPLAKVNVPKTASDMRPISPLPLLGKIIEHIISNRLKTFLKEHNILTEKQHGLEKKDQLYQRLLSFYTTYIIIYPKVMTPI